MNIGSVSLTGLSSQVARVASNAQDKMAASNVAAQGQGGQQALQSSGQAVQGQVQQAQQLIAAATGVGGKINTYA
jgi:hypothetical protein